jgi:hypothetical protein
MARKRQRHAASFVQRIGREILKPKPTTADWAREVQQWFASIVRPWLSGPVASSRDIPPGETIYNRDLGDGPVWYRLTAGAPNDVLYALEGLSDVRVLNCRLEAGDSTEAVIQRITKIIVRISELVPLEHPAKIGLASIERAKQMREDKIEHVAERQIENRRRAEQALSWARQQYPTAAADDKLDFLKQKAAEREGISKRTLNRWLAKK